MNIFNLATHTVEYLNEILINPNPRLTKKELETIKLFREIIEEKAIHFKLPDGGNILDDDWKGLQTQSQSKL